MKPKKTEKANLERKRIIFLQIGMILTLSAILFAFEWKTSEVTIKDFDTNNTEWIDTEVLPPVTMPEAEVKEVKPPSFDLEIIKDDNEIKIEDNLLDLFRELEDYVPEDFDIPVKEEEVVNDEPFIVAEFMPTFQGQESKYFRNYIAKNVSFPEEAKINGVSGTVYASFIIDTKGYVTDVKIERGVHPVIDNAVLNVIKSSPKWEPGMNNGRFVRVKFTMPISFKLI